MSRPHREPSSRNGRRLAAATAIACFMWAGNARADDAPPPVTPRVELRYSLWLDIGVTAGVTTATTVWVLVRPDLVSNDCVICDKQGSLNPVDDFFRTAFKRNDTRPAAFVSDIFGYGLAPLNALGLGTVAAIADRRGDEAPLDALLVAEATSIDIALDQVFLATLRRERPSFHAITDPDEREATRSNNSVASFPSGHVSAAFAMGASAGTIAHMRGYRLAPLVWIIGGRVVTFGWTM